MGSDHLFRGRGGGWFRAMWAGMEVYVDGRLIFKEEKNYDLSAKRPVRVHSAYDSVIEVRSIMVKELAPGTSEQKSPSADPEPQASQENLKPSPAMSPHSLNQSAGQDPIVKALGTHSHRERTKVYTVLLPETFKKVELSSFTKAGGPGKVSLNFGYGGQLKVNGKDAILWKGRATNKVKRGGQWVTEGPTWYRFFDCIKGQDFSTRRTQFEGVYLDVTTLTHPGENSFEYTHADAGNERGILIKIQVR